MILWDNLYFYALNFSGMSFAQKILDWYTANKRDLPWRETRDPYKIWLSEIILQQTRVAQGMPYYLKFVEAFPTVHDLAGASEEKVLKLWQGLGYYSRARNLHATAKKVATKYDGYFPKTYEGLLELKGVGDYTASAIASICFYVPEPVVDGNVYRVLARYFGVEMAINSGKGIKYFKSLAREVMDIENIRDYNQGIMEFGAVQCTPKNPDCMFCPLSDACVALQEGRVQELPVKIKKGKIRHRHFNYLVLQDPDGKTLLRKRTGKGIWQNLWEFPLLESEKAIDRNALKKELQNPGEPKNLTERTGRKLNYLAEPSLKKWGLDEIFRYNERPIIHKLSHQHLHTTFWIIKTEVVLEDGIPPSKLEEYPVPVLIAEFLKKFEN